MFHNQVTYPTNSNPQSIAAMDLNNDDMPDIVVANNADHTVSVLHNVGDGTFLGQPAYAAGAYAQSPIVADLNGDNKSDIVVANSRSNNIGCFLASLGIDYELVSLFCSP
ncbi:unnamed protein product [Adineta ricciae]|uniref:VCBS repeat-containing protein n=1 Tax=Adineta ricciae TaxID=249248 RepID=A0A815KP82_ADIRI|nr:unnamed protein product [Adineta ricciae]CAF1393675.1 unnamed protein product [Adineta ricciae]